MLVRLIEIWFQSPRRFFSHEIYFTNKCYKYFVFGEIYKYNAEINNITATHRKGTLPLNLTNHTWLILIIVG